MLTQAMVEGLGARVIEPEGVKLPNGCIKTADGMIVVPRSRYREGLRTGKPAELDEEAPKAQALQQPAAQQAQAVEPPRAEPSRVTVTFTFPAMGQIPSQYTAIGTGADCVVLGMIPGLSFTPPVSSEEEIKTFQLSTVSGNYAFTGLEFAFADAVRYIVLLKVGE